MDKCNEIVRVAQEKLKKEEFDEEPEVKEPEKKKPKKTEKQIFYIPNK
tara:strand:- start:351 stop:494 length:144 start_codon:yes stop_codon:yes gene_type:complete